jgi:AGCS family alanine or glycine:cation symporter
MGSTPHAHAAAEVAHPADQGLVAMMGVFIDTFIILTMTALVILSTGVLGNGETGSVLAQSAFNAGLGSVGPVFIAFCMLFFAFTTIVGWYYFGEVNVRALFGDKAVKVYAVIVVLCVAVGSTLKVDLVWNMSDMFNGLMVLPNLIALLPCIGIVKKLTKEYELKK